MITPTMNQPRKDDDNVHGNVSNGWMNGLNTHVNNEQHNVINNNNNFKVNAQQVHGSFPSMLPQFQQNNCQNNTLNNNNKYNAPDQSMKMQGNGNISYSPMNHLQYNTINNNNNYTTNHLEHGSTDFVHQHHPDKK